MSLPILTQMIKTNTDNKPNSNKMKCFVSGRQHDLSSPSHPSAVAAAAAAAALSHRSGFLTHFYANDARSPFHRNSSG